MGENVRVLADEDHSVFQHNESEEIKEGFESKHAEYRINPFSCEESFSFIPISEHGDFLLIYESEFVLLVEIDLFELEISDTVVEEGYHSFVLKFRVSLLYSKFDVLIVVFVYS